MKIILFINDNDKKSHVASFCIQSQKIKFLFQKLSNFKKFNDYNKLIIIKNNLLTNNFKTFLNENFKKSLNEIIFFIPKLYSKYDFDLKFNKIYYPLKFSEFENAILKYLKKQMKIFKNLELINDNILLNNSNKKQIHLTEIEAKIILLLIKNKIVHKNTINKKALNQSSLIDSKSLESHLYRLRRKLLKLDSKKQIILLDNKEYKLT